MAERSKFFETNSIILERDAEQEAKILDQRLAKYKKFVDEKTKAEQDALKRLKSADDASQQDAKRNYKNALAERQKAELDYEKQKKSNTAAAERAAEQYALNLYRSMNARKKFEYNETLKSNLRQEQQSQQEKHRLLMSRLLSENNASKKASLRKQLEELEIERNTTKKYIDEVTNRNTKLGMLPVNRNAAISARKQDAKYIAENATQQKAEAKQVKDRILHSAKYLEAEKKLQELKKTGTRAEIQEAKTTLANIRAESKEYALAERQEKQANHDLTMSMLTEVGAKTAETASKIASKVVEQASQTIEGNLDAMFGQQGRMMGRLQGSAIDWADTVQDVSTTIGLSGVVSKKSVVAKMVELVDSGVAYNLDMRAFLAETSQNIASTFDATNGTLLRLIRIQQADTTAARLGMEASLTKLFNNFFSDTSYLAADISQNVSDALLDASASMSRDQALSFEYIVQKWLGSLYSVGASSDVVSKIALGINYLGTGNLNAISQDDALQNLLTMSASRSGISYTDMLSGGLSAETTNDLLRSMIELLSEIATSQDNNITKSAYADLFGMSVTDLSTFSKLTTSEINNLYRSTQNYSSLVQETSSQLSEMSSRINMSTMIDTVIDNAMVGVATNIGSNAATYGTWKALGLLKEYVGSVEIPSVLAFGTGLADNIDLLNVAQTGMLGMSLIGTLLQGVNSLRQGGAINLANWNFDEYTSRGGNLKFLTSGSSTGTSYSAKLGVGSASGEDVEMVSLKSATDKAYESSLVSEEQAQEGVDIPKKIYEAIDGNGTDTVLNILKDIDDKLNPERVFYTAIAGTVQGAADRVLTLSTELSAAKVNSAADSQETTSSAISNIATAISSIGSNKDNDSLGNILEAAVREAVSSVLSSYGTLVNPVHVTLGGLL